MSMLQDSIFFPILKLDADAVGKLERIVTITGSAMNVEYVSSWNVSSKKSYSKFMLAHFVVH